MEEEARAMPTTNEKRRLVESQLQEKIRDRYISVDDFLDVLRRQVAAVREEDPSLQAYHLHDLKVRVKSDDVQLQFDFRR